MAAQKRNENTALVPLIEQALDLNTYQLAKKMRLKRIWLYNARRSIKLHPWLYFKLFEVWTAEGKRPSEFLALCESLKPADVAKYIDAPPCNHEWKVSGIVIDTLPPTYTRHCKLCGKEESYTESNEKL